MTHSQWTWRRAAPLVAAAFAAAGVQAQEGPSFKLGGFGTFAAVHSTESKADYVTSFAQRNGSGATRPWAFDTDTRLGVQADASFGSAWSATAQLLSQYRYDGSFTPDLAMAFVKWKPASGWELRVGRLPWSAYTTSDYRKVGYSLPWVRPPLELYMLSFDQIDGADLTWRTQWGDAAIRLQGVVGRSERRLPADSRWTGQGLVGGNLLVERGNLTLRFSHLAYRGLTTRYPEVERVWQLLRAAVPAEVDRFEVRDKPATYTTLGAAWDDGEWFVNSELAYGATERTYLADGVEAYVTAGRRFGSLTPYVGWAKLHYVDHPKSAVPYVQAVIDAARSREQQTLTLGLRWDAMRNTALKLQFDRVRNADGALGTLAAPRPGFERGGRYSVWTATVDFVF